MEEKEIEMIINQAIEKAIKAERIEAKEKERRKAYNLTFRYLKQYNDMVKSIGNETGDTGDTGDEFLKTMEQGKKQTAIVVANMKRCLEELKQEQEEKGQKSKYDVLEMYFFEKMTYGQIVEKIPMGDSTPRRWVSEMVNILAVKLFGVTAIHK